MNMMGFFHTSTFYIIAFVSLILSEGISGASFTIVNKCQFTVWPGVLGNSQLDTTGFELRQGGSRSFELPPGWSGRVWGRSGCTFDQSSGQGSCLTGHCGSNQIECNGYGAIPPATLAEFTIGSGTTLDFYDVSLVDGYNLPMIVEPSGGSGSCMSTGCVRDLNLRCPAELRSREGTACRSACEAFGNPEYCCSGAYGSPATCKPSKYSAIFKSACPRSYSYAYDDATSTFTCGGADYSITFCPSSSSEKSASHALPTMPSSTDARPATPSATDALPATPSTAESSGDPPPQEAVPTAVGSSWLRNFVTGDSSQTVEAFSLCSSLVILSSFISVFSSF